MAADSDPHLIFDVKLTLPVLFGEVWLRLPVKVQRTVRDVAIIACAAAALANSDGIRISDNVNHMIGDTAAGFEILAKLPV